MDLPSSSNELSRAVDSLLDDGLCIDQLVPSTDWLQTSHLLAQTQQWTPQYPADEGKAETLRSTSLPNFVSAGQGTSVLPTASRDPGSGDRSFSAALRVQTAPAAVHNRSAARAQRAVEGASPRPQRPQRTSSARRQAIQDDDEDYESPGSKPRGGKASIQDKNRRAQKRFRERAKEKEKEREQHMNELEGLVSRLKLENARLEDRNRLLEKVVEARSQPQPNALGLATPVPAVAVSASSHPTLEEAFLEDETAHIAATTFPKDLVLSMPGGQPMSLDSKQIFELSATQVWDIYEVYARKLKQCLDDGAEQDPESPAGQDLVLYTSEVCSLLLRAGAANPVTLRRLHRERNTLARRQALGDFDFDRRMAVLLELTDKQKRQMIDIGTGFRQRVMELSVERKSFYAKLQLPPGMGRGSEEAVDEFIQACELLTTLKINLRKEHWEVLNFLTKMFEICSHVQIAKFMLASLPRWFDYVAMCTVLALDAGELDLNVLIKLLGKQ